MVIIWPEGEYVGVHGSGTIINPMLAEGQVHGPVA